MKFNEFLKAGKLKEKKIKIEGIDEELTIRQLSMIEQLNLIEKYKINEEQKELKDLSEKQRYELIKQNTNFRLEALTLGLVGMKLSLEELKNLDIQTMETLGKIADEILEFSNKSVK